MIHPAQARAAADREAGLLDSEALSRAAEIVRLYHEAGGGALVLDGKVYEAMHIARLERLCIRRS